MPFVEDVWSKQQLLVHEHARSLFLIISAHEESLLHGVRIGSVSKTFPVARPAVMKGLKGYCKTKSKLSVFDRKRNNKLFR